MARYIDADLLKQAIFAKWYTCEEIDETIDQQPTADVKPVVRGEWVEDGAVTKCSVCGNSSDYCGTENFCNYCGADMRGGEQ